MIWISDDFTLTRLLPKTGQTVERQAGDDGTYEAGWWKGRFNSNNCTRFIAETIGGHDIVLDRATGLIWAADGNQAGCNNGNTLNWAAGITYANGLNFAGFSDWRMPNINELFSLVNYSLASPAIHAGFFPNTSSLEYWTGTSMIWDLPNKAWEIHFGAGLPMGVLKTDSYRIRCVFGGL